MNRWMDELEETNDSWFKMQAFYMLIFFPISSNETVNTIKTDCLNSIHLEKLDVH